MQRTYLAAPGPAGLLGAGLAAAVLTLTPQPFAALPAARANVLFESRAVEASRFMVLAKPVARDDWSLLVLEQIQRAPACWQQRPDGLIDPSLTRFDFTGICSRYIDSNGYSLRVGSVDLANRYRLKLRQVGGELRLLGSTPDASGDLLVGRGSVPSRDRDGFVAITLEPDWQLRRRVYGGQTLSHLYFASDRTLAQLSGGGEASAPSRSLALGGSEPSRRAPRRSTAGPTEGSGPIALTVIPFRP